MIFHVDKESMLELLKENKRIDGRKFDEFRNIKINIGAVPKAEGSAEVFLGKTHVIAGVKMDIGSPFSDRPDEGVLMTNAEFAPLASPDFESGPPGPDSIEMARVVDRAIRESETIDTKSLCIKSGEKVWMIFVDIYIIDYDGNLIDASSIAALAALKNAKFPKLIEEGDDYKIDYEIKTDPLVLKKKPLCVTFGKIGNYIVADPSALEEEVMDARLTVGSTESELCSMQKGGENGGFTPDEIKEIVKKAKELGDELRKLIN